MATHSSILVWKIPWVEEPGRQSMGLQRVRHNWVTSFSFLFSPRCPCPLLTLKLLRQLISYPRLVSSGEWSENSAWKTVRQALVPMLSLSMQVISSKPLLCVSLVRKANEIVFLFYYIFHMVHYCVKCLFCFLRWDFIFWRINELNMYVYDPVNGRIKLYLLWNRISEKI